jgi:hypothetical protein
VCVCGVVVSLVRSFLLSASTQTSLSKNRIACAFIRTGSEESFLKVIESIERERERERENIYNGVL